MTPVKNVADNLLDHIQVQHWDSRRIRPFSPTMAFFTTVDPKIQQTKMLVTCQRFGDWFLFGLVWQYSSIQKNIIKVGSKSLLLTCTSNKL